VLSYLRVIANTNDDVNLLRIINTPRRGIGKATVQRLREYSATHKLSLWQALVEHNEHSITGGALKGSAGDAANLFQSEHDASSGDADGAYAEQSEQTEIGAFVTLIQKLREDILGKRGLSQKVKALVDEIDYWSFLVVEYKSNEKAARAKFANIQTLLRSIEYWEKNPDNFDPTLYPYLNRISLLTRGEDDGTENAELLGKVNLMTIHSAKGLEFPVVFIAGVEDGIIPHKRSLEDAAGDVAASPREVPHALPAALEEERRLFYVAITRAKELLVLSCCKQRKHGQSLDASLPSPFLQEIPAALIKNVDTAVEGEAALNPEDYFGQMRSRLAAENRVNH
jgi:DNA helicase-2/ATP-dependent DNA helicase PcrA